MINSLSLCNLRLINQKWLADINSQHIFKKIHKVLLNYDSIEVRPVIDNIKSLSSLFFQLKKTDYDFDGIHLKTSEGIQIFANLFPKIEVFHNSVTFYQFKLSWYRPLWYFVKLYQLLSYIQSLKELIRLKISYPVQEFEFPYSLKLVNKVIYIMPPLITNLQYEISLLIKII